MFATQQPPAIDRQRLAPFVWEKGHKRGGFYATAFHPADFFTGMTGSIWEAIIEPSTSNPTIWIKSVWLICTFPHSFTKANRP